MHVLLGSEACPDRTPRAADIPPPTSIEITPAALDGLDDLRLRRSHEEVALPDLGHPCLDLGQLLVGIYLASKSTSRSIRSTLVHMRTTLDIPEELLREATELLQFRSKTDTVVVALRELVRRRRLEELKTLAGHVPLAVDIDASRRRPRRGRMRRDP